MRSIEFLNESNLNKGGAHSYILNVIRGLAALQVAVHHFRNHYYADFNSIVDPSITFKLFAFATGFANHAVMMFFAISGWLVGGSVLNNINKKNFVVHYAIDRVSRLWVVLVPTFILSGLIAYFITSTELPGHIFNGAVHLNLGTLLGNLFGLQTVVVEQYAANYPLWSLANETWYYVSFPLMLALFMPAKGLGFKLSILCTLLVIIFFLPSKILVFSSVWLLGALFSRVKLNVSFISKTVLLLMFFAVLVYSRYKNMHDDIYIIWAYVVSLLLFISANQHDKLNWMKVDNLKNKAVEFLSDISFSLYVVHVPLIYLTHALYIHVAAQEKMDVTAINDGFVFTSIIVLSLLATYLFHCLFERKHLVIRKFLKKRFVGS